MIWVLVIGATWLLLGAAVALLIARSIHLADAKAAADAAPEPDVVVDPAPTQPDTPVVLPFPAPAPSVERDPANGQDSTKATEPDPARPSVPGTRPPVNGGSDSQAERTRAARRSG